MLRTKCGIFTFSGAPNYGASLQTYALKRVIESFGYDCCVVNYSAAGNSNFEPIEKEKYINSNASLPYRILYSLFAKKPYREKMDKFHKFWKAKLNRVDYEEDLQDLIDIAICGSDQIWNPLITSGYDSVFFAQGFKRAFSYAASVGDIGNVIDYNEEEFLRLLQNFDSISVREEELCDYLHDKGITDAVFVLDPTLLPSKIIYDELISETCEVMSIPKKPYLCVYQLNRYPKVLEVAKKIAREKKLELVELSGCDSVIPNNRINNAGPLEFIQLIKNADYVVTNSYHGTLFSLIFHREFNAIYSNTGNSRLATILRAVGLENRIVDEASGYTTEEIDYILVDNKLNILREKSMEYIRRALDADE